MQQYANVVADPKGNVIKNASVRVLKDGLPTLIYSADNTDSLAPNPLTTDALGQFAFYAPNGDYLLEVSAGGKVFPTIGPVTLYDPEADADRATLSSLAAPEGSELVGYGERTVSDKLAERVTPQDFMTEAQRMDVYLRTGSLDVTAAIQAGLDHLNAAGGGRLHFPAGRYRKADTSATLVMYSNITISGDGDASVLFHDDRDTNARRDLLIASACNNIAFENFQIEGTLATYTNETNMSQALAGNNIVGLRIQNVTFRSLRYMATAFGYVRGALITGCRFIDIQRDGARCTHSQDVRVIGNQFHRVADDAVALHSVDSTSTVAGSGVDWATAPVGSGFIVADNQFFACQGIKILGGKMVRVVGNTMRFMLRGAVLVANTSALPEGNTPMFAIDISGNTILDTMGDRGANYVIKVDVRAQDKGALTAQPGITTSIFDYSYLNDIDVPGTVSIGAWGVKIKDNTIAWSAKRGVNFSAYGYGNLLDRSGAPNTGFFDLAMTDASYRAHGIVYNGPVRGLEVKDNLLAGGGTTLAAILLAADSDADNSIVIEDGAIDGNTITDWPAPIGIQVSILTPNGRSRLHIRRNTLNLDPFFRATGHNADNTWATSSAVVGLQLSPNASGGVVEGNTFKNVAAPGVPSASHMGINYIYCSPVAAGDDAGNKGVRVLEANSNFVFFPYDADPASATYGAVSNGPTSMSSAMPSTGTYVRGHYVKKHTPTVAGAAGSQYTVAGWWRATTGSSHVAGTDWIEQRMLTGT